MAKKKIHTETVKKQITEKPIDGYYVVSPFKDKKQYGNQSYNIGDDVSHFETERLKLVIDRGLVEFMENQVVEQEKSE